MGKVDMAGNAQEVVTTISEVRDLHTTGGKNYWLMTGANRQVFKTWNPSVAAMVYDNPGRAFRIIFHEDTWQGRSGPMTDNMVDDLAPAPMMGGGGPATGAFAGSGSPDATWGRPDDAPMTTADWDRKEDRDHIRRLLVTHYQLLTKDAGYVPTYDDLVGEARRRALADLEWLRTYATSDVPF
jgi:hypothetical protein